MDSSDKVIYLTILIYSKRPIIITINELYLIKNHIWNMYMTHDRTKAHSVLCRIRCRWNPTASGSLCICQEVIIDCYFRISVALKSMVSITGYLLRSCSLSLFLPPPRHSSVVPLKRVPCTQTLFLLFFYSVFLLHACLCNFLLRPIFFIDIIILQTIWISVGFWIHWKRYYSNNNENNQIPETCPKNCNKITII